MIELVSGVVRMFLLQFNCSKLAVVPTGLGEKDEESVSKLISRRSQKRGTQFIESTPGVSLARVPAELAAEGYILVDGFYQMRPDNEGRMHPMVQFAFVSEEDFNAEAGLAGYREVAKAAFEQMCTEARWSALAYLNSFFKDGEDVDGAHSISINMNARDPLVNPDGTPKLQWKKDERNQRIGDAPVPIEPKSHLRIADNDILVVST